MKKGIFIQDLIGILLLTMASLFFIAYAMQPTVMDFQEDEMTLCYTAERVSNGELPYYNFFSFVPPLTIYTYSWNLRCFGVALLTERSLHLILVVLQVSLFYLFLRVLSFKPLISFFIALLLPSFVLAYWPIPSHHWVATFVVALFFLFFMISLISKSPVLPLLLGLSAGLVPLSIQDKGALIALFFLIYLLKDKTHSPKWRLASFVSFFMPCCLFILYYLGKGGRLFSLYECLIRWPLTAYKQRGGFNDVNFLNQLSTMFTENKADYMLFSIMLMILAILFAGMIYKIVSNKKPQSILIASFWCLFFTVIIYLRGRQDFSHLTFLLPLILSIGLLVHRKSVKKHIRITLLILVCLYFGITLRWVEILLHKPFVPSQYFKVDDAIEVALPIRGYLKDNPQFSDGRTFAVPYGAFYYFNCLKNPLPIECYLPESKNANADWEISLVSTTMTTGKIRHIVIPVGLHGDPFIKEPTIFLRNLSFFYRRTDNIYGHYIYEWKGSSVK